MPMTPDLYLFKHGWETVELLPQDGTARTYTRVRKGDKTALLMDVPPTDNTLPEFLRIGAYLNKNGIRTPDIYEADKKLGLALIEDFGSTPMRIAIERGDDMGGLYDKALALLDQIKALNHLPPLRDYNSTNVHIGRQRVIGWYLPASVERPNARGEVERYFAVWDEIEKQLPYYKSGFVHGDYHVDNLMVLDDGSLGVIDFQDAMYGPQQYDLGNLLEDMRMEVPADIQAKAKARLSEEERAWMRILTTQFHCRLTGLILWWAIKDNKPHYTRFLPRVENYIRAALKDPILKPLKDYFDDLGLDFTLSQRLNIEQAKQYIAPDAF